MATRIIEYGGMVYGAEEIIPATQLVKKQSAMTATGTSAQSSAVNAATSFVFVESDEAVYVDVGPNPTATADCHRIQAGGSLPFSVGTGWKVAIKL